MDYHFHIDQKQKNHDGWKVFKKKQRARTVVDATADYGPPDCPSNFQPATRQKRRAQNVTGNSDAKRVALSSQCNYTPNPILKFLVKMSV